MDGHDTRTWLSATAKPTLLTSRFAALPEIDENWRHTYAARLTATTPTNQARRERDLPSYPVVDGLTFGSDQERRVYAALKRLQADFPEAETIASRPFPGFVCAPVIPGRRTSSSVSPWRVWPSRTSRMTRR